MRYAPLVAIVVLLIAVAAYLPADKLTPIVWAPEPEPSLTVLFVGDIMLDRNVARTAEREGAHVLFAGVTSLFEGVDVRVGNLEGAITTNQSLARQNNQILRFTFDPEVVREALGPLRFDALSLANNHTLDFYQAGYAETLTRVRALGAQPFGHPLNVEGNLSTVVIAKGKTLCLVGYHSLFDADTTSVMQEIESLRPDCWRIVVMPHWGEEYETRSHAGQQRAAHSFIDAGADLVVGAHPHVVQEVETYKGKAIFYSLGNFMFDQNFSWETTHGLAVIVTFTEGETAFTLIPTTIKDQKAGLAEGEDRQKILEITGIRLPQGQVADFTLP